MLVTTRLGEWDNGLISAEIDYDDVTFSISTLRLINHAPYRVRFAAWIDDGPSGGLFVAAGVTRTFNVGGKAFFMGTEPTDGSPAGNVNYRVEWPI